MKEEYPLFIIAEDDKTMELIKNISELNLLEENDIIDGLYSGWDKNGRPFKILWEEGQRVIKIVSNKPQLNKLKEAILNHINIYCPKKPFIYSGPKNDMVELFLMGEMHTKKRKLCYKLRTLFTKNT